MKTFSSLAAVMGLWLAVSFLLWLTYRIFRRREGARQFRLADDAIGLIAEGADVFSALRTRASLRFSDADTLHSASTRSEDALREDVGSLLNEIEARSPYFERVSATKKAIEKTFRLNDFEPLGELLQIRRDFWAASEIFLMDDVQALDPTLGDAEAYHLFQKEAKALLFRGEPALARMPSEDDPVEMRLEIVREEVAAFKVKVQADVAVELEKSRFPSASELIAVPWAIIRAGFTGLRELRHLISDMAVSAQSLARAMTSRGLRGAAQELRRVRGDLPGQFATAFERAGGLARQGGQSLKRHYEFVIEAQELRARYAELLARAPDLTETGTQFLARLEIERRAEQLRRSSDHLLDWARQKLVIGIANLIAALQVLQARITPSEHKQLAPLTADANGFTSGRTAESKMNPPLRVLLPAAAPFAATALAAAQGRAGGEGRSHSRPQARTEAEEERGGRLGGAGRQSSRLRDLVTGAATELEDFAPASSPPIRKEAERAHVERPLAEAQKAARSNVSAASAGSLLERLSMLDAQKPSGEAKAGAIEPPRRGWFASIFRKRG